MPLLINGQPFIPPEGLDINESNPYSSTPIAGGIRVNWGNGIENIIGGTSTTTTERKRATASATGFNYSTSAGCESIQTYLSFEDYDPAKNYTINFSLSPTAQCSTPPARGSRDRTLRENGVGILNSRVYKFWYVFRGNTINSNLFNGAQVLFSYIHSPIHQLEDSRWTVVSNTNESVERIQAQAPNISLLAGSCNLIINYSNGSQSPLLEFSQCPTVEIVPDCPCVCPSTLTLADLAISLTGVQYV